MASVGEMHNLLKQLANTLRPVYDLETTVGNGTGTVQLQLWYRDHVTMPKATPTVDYWGERIGSGRKCLLFTIH